MIDFAAAVLGDRDFLEEMLYEALFIPPGESRPTRSVLRLQEIAHYVAGWGRPGDFGLIARSGEEAVGAAWFRLFRGDDRGFGFIDERTPELSMAVRPDCRGLGIGSALLERLCAAARERGFGKISLSVDIRNPALRLYRRLGFEVVTEADSAYTMVKDLAAAAAPSGAGRVSLRESVAQAMDGGSDDRIVPFLPYIFQDAWELGAVPGMVVDLVRRSVPDPARLRVLDLGCGKGAVTVGLARAFGCRCLGLDAIGDFVAFADSKAVEAGVARHCRFEVADIRERIEVLGRFDVVVLGAIGPVFGDYRTTLGTIEPHLTEGGLVIVDDGYLPDESPAAHPQVQKRGDMLRQIAAAGMRIVEEVPVPDGALESLNETLFRALEGRCSELAGMYPEMKDVFEGYVRRQIEENAFLEGDCVCVLMAIGRAAPAAGPEAPRGR